MMQPRAAHVRGRAIVAVCDLSKDPDMGLREHAVSGTTVIYRNGREVARSAPGATDPAFFTEIQALGLSFGG